MTHAIGEIVSRVAEHNPPENFKQTERERRRRRIARDGQRVEVVALKV